MAEDNEFIGKEFGSYLVVADIASGNFCRVFRAQHKFLTGRPVVAIKLMHSTRLHSEKEREDFKREAQILDNLKHPHILPIIDFGIDDHTPYLITEYASQGLSARSPQAPPTSSKEALTILKQVGEALQYAHQQDPVVVHRDLKPENILFNAKGEALLADFGIAAVLDSVSIKHIDASGSPPYMAPEQFEGNICKECDQYALGCIAYELLTRRRPFVASELSLLVVSTCNGSPHASNAAQSRAACTY